MSIRTIEYEDMVDKAIVPLNIEISQEQKDLILHNICSVDSIIYSINDNNPDKELRSTQVIGFIIFYSLKELKLI